MENICYIEDEASQREVTERLYFMCKKVFHSEVGFLTADSWEAGMKTVSGGHVSVMLLDLVLPPLSRENTLELVSRNWRSLPPIVAFTGIDIPATVDQPKGLREKAFDAGCDDFLLKTEFNHRPEDLFARVYHAFLRRQRANA